jgi:DNA ligase 1
MSSGAPFLGLVEALEAVKATTSKKEKVRLVAAYLRGLRPDDALVAARVSSGRTSQRGSRDEAQVGPSTLLQVLKEVTGVTPEGVSKAYLRHGDLGEVAQELLGSKQEQTLFSEPLTLGELDRAFGKLRGTKGSGSAAARKGVVKSLVLRASPVEGKYIVKVLTGEMRTGLVSGLLEEAIASAYSLSKESAARAHMLLGDIGLLAQAAASGRVGSIRMEPFRPVNFMLAEPMADPVEVAEHFGKKVYAEYKYDGVRVQVHKRDDEFRLYSRRLEDISTSFPEVPEALGGTSGDFILDGEVVPFKDGRPLPFQLLQRRLRRLEQSGAAARDAPVVYFAFDILLRDGEETVGFPLEKRRKMLRRILDGSDARPAQSVTVESAREIGDAFRESRDLGYEGLVVKDPASFYVMGKRGSGWVKLKEDLDTLDVVIVGAEYGHGKRAGVISDYTFAVRDGDELKTIGKAYSGLSDAEIADMTDRLKAITVRDHGHWRDVRPEVVLEVAFDSIQLSGRHSSGFALRFPRIKRVRSDKAPAQANTIEDVRRMFADQKVKLDR